MATKEQVVKKLKRVIDSNTGASVYDMGLISELAARDGKIRLTFTPSSFCPLSMHFASQIERSIKSMRGVKQVDVKIARRGKMTR